MHLFSVEQIDDQKGYIGELRYDPFYFARGGMEADFYRLSTFKNFIDFQACRFFESSSRRNSDPIKKKNFRAIL